MLRTYGTVETMDLDCIFYFFKSKFVNIILLSFLTNISRERTQDLISYGSIFIFQREKPDPMIMARNGIQYSKLSQSMSSDEDDDVQFSRELSRMSDSIQMSALGAGTTPSTRSSGVVVRQRGTRRRTTVRPKIRYSMFVDFRLTLVSLESLVGVERLTLGQHFFNEKKNKRKMAKILKNLRKDSKVGSTCRNSCHLVQFLYWECFCCLRKVVIRV